MGGVNVDIGNNARVRGPGMNVTFLLSYELILVGIMSFPKITSMTSMPLNMVVV
jgi:hypothetical protein